MKPIAIIASIVVLFALSGCSEPGYDKARYEQMKRVIDGSTNELLGVSLADASKLLSLDGANWDKGYTSVPLGQLRIYHFRGFYLMLSLNVLPPGITPTNRQNFAIGPELERTGIWWVANFYPALHIDKLTDPRKRMEDYWHGVQKGFRERTEEMKKLRGETNR